MRAKIFRAFLVLSAIITCCLSEKIFADASEQLKQAENYYEASDYPRAEQVYIDILKQYPDTGFAFAAQKKLTILYIAWGDKSKAEASFEKLATIAASADIAAAIRDMQKYYSSLQNHEDPDKRFQYYQDLSICRRQLDVIDQSVKEYAMWSQVRLAMSNVERGDDTAVQSAVDKLIAEFSDNSQIARGVHEVALKYRVLKKYERAIKLYQYVIEHWPDAEYTVWSQLDLAKSYVAIGDEVAAQAAVDRLLTNFSSNPYIEQVVYDMATYYREAKKQQKAVILYQHIINNHPEKKNSMWSQRDLAMSYIDLGDDPNAQAAIDRLIDKYVGHIETPQNVYEIAKYYRERVKYEQAIKLYQYIVDNWPTADHAIWSQLDIAMSYAVTGNEEGAQVAMNKLITNFSGNPHIAWVVYEMAKHYMRCKNYEKARQICQYIIEHWPKAEHAMWAQAELAKLYLALENDPNAEAAVNKLLGEFSGYNNIAKAVHDTAFEFRKSGKYEMANKLDQYVIDRRPQDEQTMWARMDIAKTDIALGNESKVQETVGNLIVDFNDNPQLPAVIFILGEEYYNKACVKENEGLSDEAKNYFRKAIIMFEKVIKDLRPHETYTAYAYHLLNECYQRFGDKYCCAYVVWHTLNYYGLTKPIDLIVKEMQLDKKDSISIYELTSALKTNRISAQAVKLDLGQINKIDKPFIQYISPTKTGQFGHFVLCIPTGSGKSVTLDGAEEPKVIDLVLSQQNTYQQTRWDGTSILINGIEKETEDNPSSGLLDLNILLQLAANWLETDLSSISVPLELQLGLRGGCPDDCKGTGKNCFSSPFCESDQECVPLAGNYACYDAARDELCQKPGSWPSCVYDLGHICSPRRSVSSFCNLSSMYCYSMGIDLGKCQNDDNYPPDRTWVRQCHN